MNRATKKNNVYVVVSAMFLLLQTGADVVFFELLTHRNIGFDASINLCTGIAAILAVHCQTVGPAYSVEVWSTEYFTASSSVNTFC